MNYVQRRHSVTCLQSHLAFTTKYRRKIFLDEHIEQLRWAFGLACEKLGIDLQEFDGWSRSYFAANVGSAPIAV
jgi:putative transposase